ncbi:hypothetical protein GQ607_006333 [Colletotrichum asianum]|uniref:Uncharacterized protein n=1 Tax=Colletotrichum asianum TaxID=702518 RepID=A0A8H3WL51_9PEZI|nr:hypothetical protein GQ607_006333 [Colletotrichum asianum]
MFLGELPTQFAPGGGPWRKHGGACTGRRMVREVGGDVGGGYAALCSTWYLGKSPGCANCLVLGIGRRNCSTYTKTKERGQDVQSTQGLRNVLERCMACPTIHPASHDPSLHPSTIDRLARRGGPGPGPGPGQLPLHALDPEVPFFKGPDPPLVTAHRSGLQSAPLPN